MNAWLGHESLRIRTVFCMPEALTLEADAMHAEDI